MTDSQLFLLEEHKSLRKEIELYLADARSVERYALIASGVTWGWLIANHDAHWLPWLIPVCITIAAAVRSFSLNQHFHSLSSYLQTTEVAFGVEGWEYRLNKPPLSAKKVRYDGNRLSIGFSNMVLVVFLLILAGTGFFMRKTLVASVPVASAVTACSCPANN